MNQHLQTILDFIQQDESLTAEEKNALSKSLKDADKELEITAFKLERTEKVKRTTAILLEETIEELEQKRKAVEAQNREAQIENALEKVRGRTMAMQRSEELPEAANNLFLQVQALGIPAWSAGYCIWDEDKQGVTFWMSSEGVMQPCAHAPLTEDPSFIHMREAYEKRDAFHVEEVGGEALITHYQYMRTLPVVGEILDSIIAAGHPLPTFQIFHCVYFSQGFLLFITYETVPKAHDIFKRFGKVFDQTYTRFLDLQKAEIQAREAQIEAALEKVRSRSLAMHKSTELKEVANTMFRQLKDLNIEMTSASIYLLSEHNTDLDIWIGMESDKDYSTESMNIPATDHPVLAEYLDVIKSRKSLFAKTYNYEEKNKIWNYLFEHSDFKMIPDERKKFILDSEAYTVSLALLKNTGIQLIRFSNKSFSEKENEILQQFSKVFEQAYTRFLDLQKAEAQTREAQIEASLERVRSRSMAMHKSDELKEAGELLWTELGKLGIASISSGYVLMDKEEKIGWMYAPNPATGKIAEPLGCLHTETKEMRAVLSSWKNKELLSVIEMDEQETIAHQTFIAERALKLDGTIFKWITAEQLIALSPKRLFLHNFNFTQGYLMIVGGNRLNDEQVELMLRFTKVFQQTYTRFLDLQKAEAQAREATIEAALERVRARTMAMHNSEDVVSATSVLLIELRKLGIETLRCGILIFGEKETFEVWSVTNTEEGKTIRSISTFNTNDHPLWQGLNKVWKQRDEFFYYYLAGEEKKDYYRILSNTPNYLPLHVDELPDQNFQGYCFPEGTIWTFSLHPHSEEDKQVMKRFTSVFSLTFRRYRDLQKAEAQAREAKIEAALERVRGKAMAMHNSEDLAATIGVFYREIEALSTTPRRCGIGLLNKEGSRIAEISTMNTTEQGDSIEVLGKLNLEGHPVLDGVHEGWLSQKEYHPVLRGAEIKAYYQLVRPHIDYPDYPTDEVQYGYFFPFPEGEVFAWTEKELAEDDLRIYRRFTTVLSLTYKRYKDLKQAEEQAREATIEASLERVRSRSMGMQKSDELREVIQVIFEQLIQLNIDVVNAGFIIDFQPREVVNVWMADSFAKFPTKIYIPYIDHPFFNRGTEAIEKGLGFIAISLTSEEKKSWLDYAFKYLPEVPEEAKKPIYNSPGHQTSFAIMKNVILYVTNHTDIPYSDAENATLIRFAKVFEQTYTRFNDLKNAEAQALEAIKQASVDRVRAEIASMRTAGDLERITPLIWNELTTLGLPFIRCGVFIMDEQQQLIHIHLSTPDGKAIAAFHLPYTTPGNIGKVLNHWQHKKIYAERWSETDFTVLADTLVQQGFIEMREQYLKTLPPGGFYLHFLPFLQGMLYVGNTTLLSDDETQLIQSVADAFSTAYARYEDFNKLELAKEQIEKTLVDLKQAQAQLVQSEKMASLGELTAGIAHEIQNPLNFVNNFSEVNTELIDELKEEIAKGNMDEVIAIAKDIKENELKINHHGKRADAIVKGMLQHSRTSTATKEPTNINALADEYLRLAYHGLRAKDKSFNATLKTDFDESIGNINIIPQDIGRVILNLITNAFYATNERQKAESLPTGQAGLMPKAESTTYEPTVAVSTKKTSDKVFISVKDNGNGIPKKVVDKIFQPFFTTKPTGQGTGLGLSLAYDIVKAHGGEMKVETKEGEGSEFIIQLPAISIQQ